MKLARYKKLEEKKPTIIFSCNPVNYNLLIEYAEHWKTSRSLMVDALLDYSVDRYKKGDKALMQHIDEIINAKKYKEMDREQHLTNELDFSLK